MIKYYIPIIGIILVSSEDEMPFDSTNKHFWGTMIVQALSCIALLIALNKLL